MVKSDTKEQKIKHLEEWKNDKLPSYISSLEEKFQSQEKEANKIISEAEKIKNSKEEVRKLIMDKIILEIRSI